MSEYLIKGATLTGIADAIRAKLGTTDPILTEEMAAKISEIETGTTEEGNEGLYQPVEYIVSDGASYIKTDYVADNATGMELVAAFPELEDRPPMGSRADSGATRFYCCYPLSATSCYYGYNGGYTVTCGLDADVKYRMQTNLMDSRLINILAADGTRLGGTSIAGTLAAQTGPVAIFGYLRGDTGAISSMREYTLYNARISQGHEIVREYIPCYRKADGVIGLYERYSGTFLENSGTGAFTKGPDVEWEAV